MCETKDPLRWPPCPPLAASYSKMFIPLTWLNFQVAKQPKSTLNSQQSGEVMGEAYFSVPKRPFFYSQHWQRHTEVRPLRSTLLFFCIVQTAGQKPWKQPSRSPCSYKSEVKGALKWNFTFAVRNHLRPLHSRLKRRVFQTCHFASRRWTVSTQTALYPAGPALHAECILLYLFTHFHLDKRCHCEEWETEPANCFYQTG